MFAEPPTYPFLALIRSGQFMVGWLGCWSDAQLSPTTANGTEWKIMEDVCECRARKRDNG